MVNIVTDKDLIWETEKYDVILVGTSIYCMLGAGFQSKMLFKYPFLDTENDKTPYGDLRKLGKRLTMTTDGNPIISLMYICGYPRTNRITVDYKALEQCFLTANAEFSGKNVATTIVGASIFDGNGDRDKCLDIITKSTPDINLTLYDYVQKQHKEEVKAFEKYINSFKRRDKEKYNYLIENKDEELKKLYLK